MRNKYAMLWPVVVVSALLGGCGNGDVQQAREEVKRNLFDAGSAQFRNEQVYRVGNEAVVCGEVNAKNRAGGYGGYAMYVVEGIGLYPVAKFTAESQADIKTTCQLAEKNASLKK
ncbi:hypothetical protein [Pseudomonas sp. CHM02]|uniref:hypothetical protein n=1 Tax=Pseudomonas sp. CHM02 TaxID=1463662 RepID=UPI0012DCEF9E|nr:hypothetical protein [Pseudomonas sp. CHM02]